MLPSPYDASRLARLYVPCKGGNDDVGDHGCKIGLRAASVLTFALVPQVPARFLGGNLGAASVCAAGL